MPFVIVFFCFMGDGRGHSLLKNTVLGPAEQITS